MSLTGEDLPVMDRTGLVVLNFSAGGPQDLLDIDLLVAGADDGLPGKVAWLLPGRPSDSARAWRHRTKLLSDR